MQMERDRDVLNEYAIRVKYAAAIGLSKGDLQVVYNEDLSQRQTQSMQALQMIMRQSRMFKSVPHLNFCGCDVHYYGELRVI